MIGSHYVQQLSRAHMLNKQSFLYSHFWRRGLSIMASLGKIEEFNPKTTNINHYLERLEQYFVANEVEADSTTSH